MKMKVWLAALAVCWGLGAPAWAEEDEPSPFRFVGLVDGPVLGVSFAVWITPSLIEPELSSGTCDPCDPDKLNAMDRPVVGYSSAGADLTSDVMVVALPILAASGSLLGYQSYGWRGVGEDVLLLAESMAVAGALYRTVSFAVRRPRPFMYTEDKFPEQREKFSAGLSFFSGHTTASFAAASSFAATFGIRRPQSKLRPLVWLASLALASVVPFCRVAAGEHFWSDVLVGAAVGSAVGTAIPYLHRRSARGGEKARALIVGPGPGGGLALVASF